MDSIEQSLITQLHEKFGIRPELEDSLSVLGVDSVSMAEFTLEIEKNFGIRVDDEVLSIDSVGQLAEYIRERVAKVTSGSSTSS